MRNKLTEIALQALGDDFAEHGAAVIAQVRREKPHHYLSVVASLLPRQLHVERSSPLGELSDAELAELEVHLAGVRARLVEQLDQANGAPNTAANFPGASRRDDDIK